ncbi:hypothetical protein MMC15_005674 [Xylographa vitiligo]|nr:hypothetical protein [Xylographa vitiligo]
MGSDDEPAEKGRPSRLSRFHYRNDDSYEFDATSSSDDKPAKKDRPPDRVGLIIEMMIPTSSTHRPRRTRHISKIVKQDVVEGRPRLSNVPDHGWDMLNWLRKSSRKRVLLFFVGIFCCLVLISYLFAHSRKVARLYWDTTVCSREVPLLITNVAVGAWMPGCSTYKDRKEQPVSPSNHTKMVTAQEELGKVASQIGQSFELTTTMVNSEFAIRDLKIRVSKSKLSQRDGLTEQLASISQSTKTAYNQVQQGIDDRGAWRIASISPAEGKWDQIAPNKYYAQFKSHGSLLEELVSSHEIVSTVMKHTIAALLQVEAELESIRDDYATPALIMQDDLIDDVLKTFEMAATRLTAAKTGLDQGGDKLELGRRT